LPIRLQYVLKQDPPWGVPLPSSLFFFSPFPVPSASIYCPNMLWFDNYGPPHYLFLMELQVQVHDPTIFFPLLSSFSFRSPVYPNSTKRILINLSSLPAPSCHVLSSVEERFPLLFFFPFLCLCLACTMIGISVSDDSPTDDLACTPFMSFVLPFSLFSFFFLSPQLPCQDEALGQVGEGSLKRVGTLDMKLVVFIILFFFSFSPFPSFCFPTMYW